MLPGLLFQMLSQQYMTSRLRERFNLILIEERADGSIISHILSKRFEPGTILLFNSDR